MLPTKFRVNWHLGLGEEAKNRRPSCIFDRYNFSYFWTTCHTYASLESIGLSVQEKKQKIDFQDGCHGSHLGFPVGMIFATFDLQVTLMLPSKFGGNWLSVQEKKRKIDFQDGGHLGFPISMILAIFDLQVTPMLPSKFGVNSPFSSGEEAKNRFSRWRPSWISDRHDLTILVYKSPWCFLASLESIGLSVQEKKRKIDFQDGGHCGHLGSPIGTILASFDLQVTPMLPSKFGGNWLSVQEKKRKIDFQDGGHGSHLGFPIGTILAIFNLQVPPMLPSKFGVNWPPGSGEEAKNRFSRWRPSWISDRHHFSYFLSTSHPDAS